MKQALVIRVDLGMSKGKIAVQAAHAAVGAAEQARLTCPEWWRNWFREGQKKVVVKASSLEELLSLQGKAVALHLPCELIRDRGLTEVPPGTVTALGVGPAPERLIDRVTGSLPLL